MKGYNLNKSSNNNLGPAAGSVATGGPGNVSFSATIADQSPSPGPGHVNANGGGCLADTEASRSSRTNLDTKIEINSKKKGIVDYFCQ